MRIKSYILFLVSVQFLCGFNLMAHTENGQGILFVQNKKQLPQKVLYKANFNFGEVFYEKNTFTYTFFEPNIGQILHHTDTVCSKEKKYNLHAIKTEFIAANQNVEVHASNKVKQYFNFFLGSDSSNWATNVNAYQNLTYQNLYTGVDLLCYSQNDLLKYDYIVKPFASPNQIKLNYKGCDKIELKNNELLLYTSVGIIKETAPAAYQLNNGKKINVACSYRLKNNMVSFIFPEGYDKTKELIIDPSLIFASFTGSTADNWGFTATYDHDGNAIAGGIAFNNGYPLTTGAFQTSFAGATDMAISKFSSNGGVLLYSTYIGGTLNDQPHSLVVNNENELFIFGRTLSTNFPVSTGAFDVIHNGLFDIVVCKLNVNGNALLASTYVGGSADDAVNFSSNEISKGDLKYNYADDARGEIICDGIGNIYVAGCTNSTNFPVTETSFQPTKSSLQDGCVFKFNSDLSTLLFSSFLGGSSADAAYGISLSNTGEILVAGGTKSTNLATTPGVLFPTYRGGFSDGFLFKINATGTAVLKATYLGTPQYDQTYFVQVDDDNDVYVYGQTEGVYAITPGKYNNPNSGQYVHKMNIDLNTTIYSTVFGTGNGKPDISPTAFLVDICENVYCAGWGGTLFGFNNSWSTTIGLPVTANAYKTTTNSDDVYFFVLRKNADSLAYATFFGGTLSKEHVDGGTCRFDKNGIAYQAVCGGCGGLSDMPTTPNVVSNVNGSLNCNYGMIKFEFNLTETVSNFNFTSDTLGCAPYTVNFQNNSTGYESILWDFDDSQTSLEISPTHTFNAPGVYDVKLIAFNQHSCNEKDTTIKKIYVSEPFSTGNNLSKSVCKGDSIQLDATYSDAISYLWKPVNQVSPNATSPIVKVKPLVTSTYAVIINDGVCTVTEVTTVTVVEPFTYTPVGQKTICKNDTVQLSVNYPSAVAYEWKPQTGVFPNAFQNNVKVAPLVTSTFSVTVSDGLCRVTDVATVTVIHPFSIIPMGNYNICLGDSIQLNATYSSALSYQWTPSGVVVPNDVAPVAKVAPNVHSTYSVKIFDGVCYVTDIATVTVGNPFTLMPVGNKNICLGTFATLNATYVNALSYTWTPSASVFPSSDVAIVNVSPNTTSTFSVNVFDGFCTVSNVATITVFPPFAIQPLQDVSICVGDSITLNASNVNALFYSWQPSNLVSPVSTNSIVKVSPSTTTFFTVALSDVYCTVYDDVEVKVNKNNTKIFPGGVVTICADSSIQLDAGLNMQVYDWSNGSHNQKINVDQPGFYKVKTIDFNSCIGVDSVEILKQDRIIVKAFPDTLVCPNAPVKLFATGANSYTWSPSIYLSSSVGKSVIAKPKKSIVYIVKGKIKECVAYDSLVVDVAALPKIDLGNDFFVRKGEEVNLSVKTDSLLNWFPSEKLSCDSCLTPVFISDSTRTFFAKAANSLGCISIDSVTVYVDDMSSVYLPNCFTPNDSDINDVYKVVYYGILNYEMEIYDRWGNLVSKWTEKDKGWDGTYKGMPAKQDVYVFFFKGNDFNDKIIKLSGNITLIR